MACSSTGINERRLNQFNKIRIWDEMASSIAYFGVQCGNTMLMENMDMTCGAVPEGTFEQVIDLNSPHQFLELYTNMVDKRFAFAVTNVNAMNSVCMEKMKEYVFQSGKELNLCEIKDFDTAFSVYNSIVLDGMPCDETKKILVKNDERLQWEKVQDKHEKNWLSVNGKPSDYYELLTSFVNGLFESNRIKLEIQDGKLFSLVKF